MSTNNNSGVPAHESPVEFSDAERNAMRAYLARAEVRMSTMHRIATAFIGGAGLMLLIPIFLRDVVDGILEVLLEMATTQTEQLQTDAGVVLTLALYAMVLFPFILSLGIPIYGVYLLLKDLVQFYYTIYMPGYPPNLLNPTFSLTALSFSDDESEKVKREAMRFEYQRNNMDFVMPFSEGRRGLYFDRMVEQTGGGILPESRSQERLRALGVMDESVDLKEVQRLNVVMGITRGLDRSLVQEVAIMEMALARNVIYLRRLLLRYVKTLLMFIWTTMVSFVMLPFLVEDRFPRLLILAFGYFVWSLAVMPIIKLPVQWLYRHRSNDREIRHIDSQLTLFENAIRPFCYVAVVTSSLGFILALASAIW